MRGSAPYFLGLFTALALVAGPAAGQGTYDPAAPGQVHASAFAAMPADLPIAVRPLDNSTDNLRLKRRFQDALASRSIPTAPDKAPLALNFETEVQETARSRRPPSLGEFKGDNRDSQVRINLWSTTQDSVTQGRRSGGDEKTGVRFILIATLDDQRTGQRLWQGQASWDGEALDEQAAYATMAPILVEQLGQTVRQRSFRLQ
ncbi:MAG: hypothetical protein HY057_10015 [Rhodospirillales bacterium]|nr:hypothetical protein [Rhodospirillales bacterium]